MSSKDNIVKPMTLSFAEATQALGISKPTLYRWLGEGRIRGFKVGKQWRFLQEDLQAMMRLPDAGELAGVRVALSAIEKLSTKPDQARYERRDFMQPLGNVRSDGEKAALKTLKLLLGRALSDRVSDLHLEPGPAGIRVRSRYMGELREMTRLPRESGTALIDAIRRMSYERKGGSPERDGRMRLEDDEKTPVEIWWNLFPSMHGDAVAMRLVDPGFQSLPLDRIGMAEKGIAMLQGLRDGLVLVTGLATPVDKRVMYALISGWNTEERKIMTVEDPVWFPLDGVLQSQVRPEEGFTFARGLQAMGRQAANVYVCGEIRDAETLRELLHASRTGHLCLASLRAAGAAACLARMAELGAEPALLSDALRAVLAVGVAGRICPKCRRETRPEAGLIHTLAPAEAEGKFYKGAGCAACRKTGYAGTAYFHELLVPDGDLRGLILKGASAPDLLEAARRKGFVTIREQALAKARAGEITLEEAVSMLSERPLS